MARMEHVPGRPRIPYAIRLGEDERKIISAAAAARGIPTSQYVRLAALERARRELFEAEPGASRSGAAGRPRAGGAGR